MFVPVGAVHVYVGSLNCVWLCVCARSPFLSTHVVWAYSIRFKRNRASTLTDTGSTESTSHNSITRNKRKINVSTRHHTTSRTIDSYSSHPWRSAPMSCPLIFSRASISRIWFNFRSVYFFSFFWSLEYSNLLGDDVGDSPSRKTNNIVFEWKNCISNDGRVRIK